MIFIKTFEARILSCTENTNDLTNSKKDFQIFKFSRSKILFTKNQKLESSTIPLFNYFKIYNKISYSLAKKYDHNYEKQFLTVIDNNMENPYCFLS